MLFDGLQFFKLLLNRKVKLVCKLKKFFLIKTSSRIHLCIAKLVFTTKVISEIQIARVQVELYFIG